MSGKPHLGNRIGRWIEDAPWWQALPVQIVVGATAMLTACVVGSIIFAGVSIGVISLMVAMQ